MKSLLRFTVAALLSMVMFIGCATTGDANAETTEKSTSVAEKSDKSSGKKAPSKKASVGEYVGQYDETMTPENSCVIFFLAGSDLEEVFKQINPNLDVDEQKFTYGLFSMYRVSVFKPCKPGSRYMLTKLRGSAHYSFQDVNWDMEFKRDGLAEKFLQDELVMVKLMHFQPQIQENTHRLFISRQQSSSKNCTAELHGTMLSLKNRKQLNK